MNTISKIPVFSSPAQVSTRVGEGRPGVVSTFSWAKTLDGWALFAFSVGVMFLFGRGEQRTLGIIMGASFFLAHVLHVNRSLRRLTPIPPEILLYSAWVIWVGVTGPFVAFDLSMFWKGFRVLAQMFVMVWLAYAILANQKNPDVLFLGILIGGVVQIALVFSGESHPEALLPSVDREMGSSTNPNGLGFAMVWTVICAFLFWRQRDTQSKALKAVFFSLLPLAVYVLLASGSRKSSLAMGAVLLSWFTFATSKGRGPKKTIAVLFFGSIALYSFWTFVPGLIENTPVGRRFEKFREEGRGDLFVATKEQSRYRMYVDGLDISSKHPIFGVGLNNFGEHFYTGQYSHSNYIEPLATTGLFGLLLYQAFYLILIIRSWNLLKKTREEFTRYRLKIVMIGVLAIMLIGVGAPHYTNQPVYLLLTAFSVYTWRLRLHSRTSNSLQLQQNELFQNDQKRLNPLPS